MANLGRKLRSSKFLGAISIGFIKFLSWLPLPVVRSLAIAYAYLLYWLPNKSKRVIKINLTTAYTDLSTAQINALVKANLIETSKTFAEIGAMWCWPQEKLLALVKQVHDQALLDEAFSQNNGVILIAPHIGNWELLVPYLSSKYPSSYLYRPPNISAVEGFMVQGRERFGGKLAPTDTRGVRTLMKALANNHVSMILPDQDPGKAGGVYAPFFERPVRTMTLLSKLKQKTNCEILCGVMKRQPGISGGFELHLFAAPQGLDSEDALQATTVLNQAVEQCVQLATEQYLWSYKRYRKPPQGLKDIYKK